MFAAPSSAAVLLAALRSCHHLPLCRGCSHSWRWVTLCAASRLLIAA